MAVAPLLDGAAVDQSMVWINADVGEENTQCWLDQECVQEEL